MPTISLCMIAKDEESNIQRCLDSVKGKVDEILVGDTGSKDNTNNLVKSSGGRVIKVPWKNDFSYARNKIIKQAKSDWILILDCDESLDRSLSKYLTSDADGFFLQIKNYSDNEHSLGWLPLQNSEFKGFFVTSTVRLFRNDPNIKFSGALHETVIDSIKSFNGKILACDVPIHHYGYISENIQEEKKKLYLKVGLEHLKKDPKNSLIHHEVGIVYKNLGDYDNAIKHFKRSHELGVRERTPYNAIGHIYFLQKKYDLAIKAYQKSVKHFPKDDSSYNNLGVIHRMNSDYKNAIESFKKALSINKNSLYYESLALTYEKSGDNFNAAENYKLALSFNHPDQYKIIAKLQNLNKPNLKYSFSLNYGASR